MPTIDDKTVRHVAELARLELNDEDISKYAQELSNIVSLIDKLNELDLDAVDMSLSADQATVYREDKGVRMYSREELMANAPVEEDGFFRVPQILDN